LFIVAIAKINFIALAQFGTSPQTGGGAECTKNRNFNRAVLLAVTCAAAAQKPIVYPSKGQSAKQQNKDDGECYVWAKQNTGYDPASPPAQTGAAATGRTIAPGRGAQGRGGRRR
jgi:hypothetical protein